MVASAPSATSASASAVELTGVWKVYRQRQRATTLGGALRGLARPVIKEVAALQGVDLRIPRGEVVAYAGPNGAGKSTTIKLLSSLLAPDRGTVRVLGLDPVRERVRLVRRIGVLFGQRTELWWDHPVAASFAWKRVVWDVPDEVYRRALAFVTDLLGLDDFSRQTARELSLGQRMRADLGMALLHEPELLLLDEPTLGLDVLAKRRMLQAVTELNRERGVTVLVTSHDMADLEQLAGRIVLMRQGHVAYDGDFGQLRQTLADRRTLLLVTDSARPPTLPGATWERSDGSRHAYRYDATRTPLPALLAAAATQAEVLDVETGRPDIDDVVANIYERWQRDSVATGAC